MARNVLFVGGGRRVELAKLFIKNGWNLFSYELDEKVPVSEYGKIIKGLSWDNYKIVGDDIEKVIDNHLINLVVPLQDEAVYVVSLLNKMTNTVYLCSPTPVAKTCFNKKEFETFLSTFHRDIYPTWTGSFPAIAKPIYGFGSRGIQTINTIDEAVNLNKSRFILQKLVEGTEISVDSYFDKKANFVDAVPRLRIRTAGGEVISSKTIQNDLLYNLTEEVGNALGIVGPTNFQYMVDKDDKPYLFEINARFGGGCTLSIHAGLDIINLIERDYFNKKFYYVPKQWKTNLLLERSYRDHFYENSN